MMATVRVTGTRGSDSDKGVLARDIVGDDKNKGLGWYREEKEWGLELARKENVKQEKEEDG